MEILSKSSKRSFDNVAGVVASDLAHILVKSSIVELFVMVCLYMSDGSYLRIWKVVFGRTPVCQKHHI